MKYISCINVRLAHEVVGCADPVMPLHPKKETGWLTLDRFPAKGEAKPLCFVTLSASSATGKKIPGMTVGVVDERSELAGSYQGVPQNDLGMRTDVLDGCPKAEGMEMLIRSMSPAVVAVDELGREEDFKAVESVIHSGCKVIATAHGNSIEDVIQQPLFENLVRRRVFERYIFLDRGDHAGTIQGIYDRNGRRC